MATSIHESVVPRQVTSRELQAAQEGLKVLERGAVIDKKGIKKNTPVAFRTGVLFNKGLVADITKDNLVIVPNGGFNYHVEPEAILVRIG